ncbi:hypothetical protein I3760_07G051200 [Carya illinoinensis]|nr:hypothetical protein I3760_07G051200 [Carya illinoinensis]
MEEHRTRDEFGPHNRRVHRPPLEDEVDGNEGYEEDGEYRERNRGFGDHEARFGQNGHEFHKGVGGHGFDCHPLDELARGMKVDVPYFFGKLDPNAFEDWLMAIENYFDWFSVSEDRKVRYVRMKLKDMHELGGVVWKNNYVILNVRQCLIGKK